MAHDERPMTQVCVLASGSKGNAVYVSNGETAILVDAGLSGSEIERRLRSRDIYPDSLDAIVVSHEHRDHIQGVGVLSRRFGLPVHMTAPTMAVAEARLGPLHKAMTFTRGASFHIGTLMLHPFSLSHDAVDPVGFTIQNGDTKLGIATDLGIATQLVCHHLEGCRLMVLEANHDVRMLQEGPYPWEVKQRITSRLGHLSNEASRDLLEKVCHEGLDHVIVAHMSETNNDPDRALSVVQETTSHDGIQFSLATQHSAGDMITLDHD
ncbi:MAG: MBL fold metallo-hydrolase [Thermodesulfobacteriota bacterium]|nr:MBL fold metallo-hydrolase [Thermodesulfobacteriota bacterium]